MPVDDWGPVIKTHMETVHTDALAAEEIPTIGQIYGYNEWPPSFEGLPVSLIGTAGGSQDYGLGNPAIAFHNVRIWFYFSLGTSLAEAQKMAWPFVERVRNEFATDMQLGGNVDMFHPPPAPGIFYDGPGTLPYAGRDYAGIIFDYLLKENESGTFPVSA